MNTTEEQGSRAPAPTQPTQAAPQPTLSLASAPLSPDAPHGHVHHQRDFGIGYGNSSGYGRLLHFTDGHVDGLFRFR